MIFYAPIEPACKYMRILRTPLLQHVWDDKYSTGESKKARVERKRRNGKLVKSLGVRGEKPNFGEGNPQGFVGSCITDVFAAWLISR